jgi:hypothetical protein
VPRSIATIGRPWTERPISICWIGSAGAVAGTVVGGAVVEATVVLGASVLVVAVTGGEDVVATTVVVAT